MDSVDIYDLFDELVNSEFIDKVITYRIKECIGMARYSIDTLENINFTRGGLEKHQRDDLEENWSDLEALTKTYIYFSGDYELNGLPAWHERDDNDDKDIYVDGVNVGWEYWSPGEDNGNRTS